MWTQVLSNPGVQIALITLAGAVAGLLVLLTVSLLFRLFVARGVRMTEEQARLADKFAQDAIAAAEEWAANMMKAPGGTKPTSSEKLAVAISSARELAGSMFKSWSETKWGITIQAQLPKVRQSLRPQASPIAVTIPPAPAVPAVTVPPPR